MATGWFIGHGRAPTTAVLRRILITVCGLVALFTPLFLWVAWSPWLFWLAIAGGCAALLIIYALIWSSPDEYL